MADWKPSMNKAARISVYCCRGWGVQWTENGGRCGVCGDPWDEFPRPHEAPLGRFATGQVRLPDI